MTRVFLMACLWLAATSSMPAQELKLRSTFKGHAESIESITFSPDGKTLATAVGKVISLWDVKLPKKLDK